MKIDSITYNNIKRSYYLCPCICCTSCCQCGRLAKEGHFSNVGWPGTVTMSCDIALEYSSTE